MIQLSSERKQVRVVMEPVGAVQWSRKAPLHYTWTPQIHRAFSGFLICLECPFHCSLSVLFGSSSREFFLFLGRPDAPLPSGHAKEEGVGLSSQMEQKAFEEEVVTAEF